MARIYISSTYKDLIEQRKTAAQVIKSLDHHAVCMEDYVTSSIRPLDKCLADVRSCDVFIGIFAWRYGSIPKGHDKSITHLEYEEARKKGIPCLIFLLDENAPWPVKLVAKGPERQKIDSLREELREDLLVSFYQDASDLSNLVKKAVTTLNPSTNKANHLEIENKHHILYDSDAPDAVRKVVLDGIKTYKNPKGYWEADFGDGIIMIYIPEGEFLMGSDEGRNEKPIRSVYLDGYWIGKNVVTVGQYMRFAEETKSHYPEWKDSNSKHYLTMGEALTGKDYPIVGVSWEDVVVYCEWLSKILKPSFCLPTEAQWEKAARGTDGRTYPWGNDPLIGDRANIADKQCYLKNSFGWEDRSIDDGYAFTSPVGSYPRGASPYGALDMAGNVWELCQDWYEENYYIKSSNKNPKGPKSGELRVMRGGSWFDGSDFCRCASRSFYPPARRDCSIGFRLARSL